MFFLQGRPQAFIGAAFETIVLDSTWHRVQGTQQLQFWKTTLMYYVSGGWCCFLPLVMLLYSAKKKKKMLLIAHTPTWRSPEMPSNSWAQVLDDTAICLSDLFCTSMAYLSCHKDTTLTNKCTCVCLGTIRLSRKDISSRMIIMWMFFLALHMLKTLKNDVLLHVIALYLYIMLKITSFELRYSTIKR